MIISDDNNIEKKKAQKALKVAQRWAHNRAEEGLRRSDPLPAGAGWKC